MRTLTCLNPDGYHSIDPETRKSIDAEQGDEVIVSDGKAEQMLRDFPDWFADNGATRKPAAKKPAAKKA